MEEEFFHRLKAVRKKEGLTQGEFAVKLNITRGAYANIEVGINNPSPDFLSVLGKEYNVSLDWLFFERGLMHLLPGDHALNNLEDEWGQIIMAVESAPEKDKEELLKSIAQSVKLYRLGKTVSN